MKILYWIFPLFCLFGSSCSGSKATTAASDDFARAIEQHRQEYKKAFLHETNSPLDKNGVKALKFYAPDERFRVPATFIRMSDAEPFEMATYSGITKPYVKFGELRFEIDGKPYQLAVYQSITLRHLPQYRDYLFIPFKDWTNGEETYGGGRYMDITISDLREGTMLLDFNKAYNPYCAYSDGYNCPVPPLENHLEVAIKAGEKNFAKAHKTKG